MQKQSEENITNSIKKRRTRYKDRIIKYRTIRDTRTRFERWFL